MKNRTYSVKVELGNRRVHQTETRTYEATDVRIGKDGWLALTIAAGMATHAPTAWTAVSISRV